MSGIRVLVAGASIAGPALGHWLHRRGAEVTVVERAPELRPGGQAVDARGVAKEVIRRMGLGAADPGWTPDHPVGQAVGPPRARSASPAPTTG